DVYKFSDKLAFKGIWYSVPSGERIRAISSSDNSHIWVMTRTSTSTLTLREIGISGSVLNTYSVAGSGGTSNAVGAGAIRADAKHFAYVDSTQTVIKEFDVENNAQLSDIVTITGGNFFSGIKYVDDTHVLVKLDPATSGGDYARQYTTS